MRGIVGYGVYVPTFRLQRSAIATTLGSPPARGTRSVASYDEDTTSMAVEASRAALSGARGIPEVLLLATTAPPYLDKTNAVAVHAALGLPDTTFAADLGGSVRSSIAALRAANDARGEALAISSDVRTGLPGSDDERDGGDAAVAFQFGDGDADPVLAEIVSVGTSTREFLERWRLPGDAHSATWDDRFVETRYRPLVERALTAAVKGAGVGPDELDRVAVAGTSPRAVRRVRRHLGLPEERFVDDLTGVVGNSGAAHPGLVLAAAFDDAEPGELIALVVLADGADVLLLRTTNAITDHRPSLRVDEVLASTRDDLEYARFLTWRGMLRREPPRRPDPEAPAAPPAARGEAWKFAFTASSCTECGARHLPPQRACRSCRTVDQMEPESMADVPGTIAALAIDRLAFSESPPLILVVVDFDGGGRLQCELTDADPATVAVGDRVEMSFRRMGTPEGVHNYFWKARPVRLAEGDG